MAGLSSMSPAASVARKGKRVPETVRVVIDDRGVPRLLCEISVMPTDASVYLHPAPADEYFWIDSEMPDEERSMDIHYGNNRADGRPKISIHQSGQVHVKSAAGRYLAGPVWIPELRELRGGHVATVTTDDFDALPLVGSLPPPTTPYLDHKITAEPGVASGRLIILINGAEPRFQLDCAHIEMRRPLLAGPLWVGLAPVAQMPLQGEAQAPGTTIILGFNPTLGPSAAQSLLGVRSQRTAAE
jgi:hypothetical protein